MDRALERMGAALAGAWEALRGAAVALGPNPLAWGAVVWVPIIALLGLALLALLLPRRPRSPAVRGRGRPDVMLPQGALELPPSSRLAQLVLTVGNLGASPVQLLEAVVREPGGFEAIVPLDALLPPHASIRVAEEIEMEPSTDDVEVELFLYVAGARRSAWTLRTRASYEPWADRWRIDPLRQRLAPARRLASARSARARREAWEEERKTMLDVPPLVPPADERDPAGSRERPEGAAEARDGARAAAVEAWGGRTGSNGRGEADADPRSGDRPAGRAPGAEAGVEPRSGARPAARPETRAGSPAPAAPGPRPAGRSESRPGTRPGRPEREPERDGADRNDGSREERRRDGRGLEFPTEF